MKKIKTVNSKEIMYINKRKRKAFWESLAFYLCRIFSVKDNLVSVCAFEGKNGFGCNPKYIVEELHRRDADYQFVWFVNKDVIDKKKFPDYINKVPNTAWNRAYWLSRSKIWIDNYRKPFGTVKRKNQYYINTWHATIGFKSIGKWRGDAFSKIAYLVSKNDSDMIDRVVVDSEWCLEMYPNGMVYDGEYLNVGAPRCDILFGDRKKYKELFRNRNDLPLDAKIVMFAPTFREGSKNGKRSVFSEIWTIDFERLLFNMKKRFGGEWYLCVRVHPQLAASVKEYKNSKIGTRVIDASSDDDMYEILAGMDAYITDYSSAAMDAGYSHMPVFIYADDINKYINDRGSMLWNMSEDTNVPVTNNKEMTPNIDVVLPYPIAKDNDELEYRILNFDNLKYEKDLISFEKGVQLVSNGNASEKVADYIEEVRRIK